VSVTISPVRNAEGVIIAASTIARDTTEPKRLAAELEAARDRAMEVSRLKSDFLATMSHEIRTPMNGVIGMIGVLLDTELSHEQRAYAETVRSSGEALLAIISDILDFSKIEAGKLDLEIIDFDLRIIVEEVADLLAEQAQAKGLELMTLVDPDVPTALRGDPGRIRQILTNLVGNAVKFTEAGEVVVRAVVAQDTGEGVLVRVEVVDTGIGISPRSRAMLFEPFSQADSSTTRIHGGSGLGLAICRQLVELMGGEIGVASEQGRGSTFTFTLRLTRQNESPPPAPARVRPAGLHVLIVDDNATNRQILEHQVTSWGMRTTIVDGPRAALEVLRDGTRRGEVCDVALLDMDMPGMDGLELARVIRDDPALAPIPLVLLTSPAAPGSSSAARAAGFSAYLTKPVRQSQLFDAIATVFGANTVAPEFVTQHTISETRALPRPRLLVAEDNTVNQKVMSAMLARLGYRADVAANGVEALDAVARIRYGAVLMDCQMPEMDGYAATAEIRRREQGSSHLPIIALTAGAMAGDRERCLASGMDDYISKPVELEHLAAVLGRWTTATSREESRSDAPTLHESDVLLDAAQITALRSLSDAPGGDEQLAGLVSTFLDGVHARLGAVRAAVAAQDGDAVSRLAHSLAGSSATMGARIVHQLARELETAAMTDLDAVDDIVDRLDAASREVAPMLRAALASPRPPEDRATPRRPALPPAPA
jgi:signal transduction histidine kinase/CheY-like chemotaxis protein/HPt (histidine-containing phosphotransfer) domain-containing protein